MRAAQGGAARALRMLALAGATLCAGTAHAGAAGAEFTMRWDPAQGGPTTPEDTLARLGLKPGKRSQFEVQYFAIAAPADAPVGFEPIMRKRSSGQQAQLTYKLRGSAPWPAGTSLKQWHCPLPLPHARKEEVDVTFLAADRVQRAYSRSCTYDGRQADLQVPATLQPQAKGCTSTMTRRQAGKLKVEEWRMADGSVLLEVSRIGADSAEAGAAFRDQVVEPLLALHAQPLQRSKSTIGGDCAK